jgi:mycothiol synthase
MNPGDFIIRHPSLDDAQATLELMVTCDIAECGDPDSDLVSLLDEWADIDLSQDAWLAFTPDNQLVGYADVSKRIKDFTFDLYIHPKLAPTGTAKALLELCEQRVKEQLDDVETGTDLSIYVSEANAVKSRLVIDRGYQAKRHLFGMRINLDRTPAAPVWPVEVSLRTLIPSIDDRMVHAFVQEAFERPGRAPQPFESWHDFMMGASNFDPQLWYLAYSGQELIGVALCFDYPENGWVRQLGVARVWRSKGIGSALLQHCFRVFQERGHRTVGLVVDADNANAYKLYEKVGMFRKTHLVEYRLSMSR